MATKEEIGKKSESKTHRTDEFAGAAKVVQDAAEQLIQFSRGAASDAEDVLASGVKKSSSLIKKYPLESALVCFGVGVIAGMLLKNRD